MKKKREWYFTWIPLLRRPLFVCLYVLIISFVTYMIVIHAVEYSILKSETQDLELYYKPIGYLEPTQESHNISYKTDDIDFIRYSDYFDYEDKRRLCAGILDDIKNDEYAGIYDDRLVNNEFNQGIHVTDMYLYGTLIRNEYDERLGCVKIAIIVDDIETGYSENVTIGERLDIQLRPEFTNSIENTLADMEIGTRYFILCYKDNSYDQQTYMPLFVNWLLIKPLDSNNQLFYIEVPPGENIDFSLDSNKELNNKIEILKENQSMVKMESTIDMKCIPDFHDSAKLYRITSGRLLTIDDSENANAVCVIPQSLAYRRELKVGDSIGITLRNIFDSPNKYEHVFISDEQIYTWKEYPTTHIELEIVGIYYSPFTTAEAPIYIPDTVIPNGYDVYPDNLNITRYSFMLNSAREKKLFIQENENLLNDIDIHLSFVKTNADEFIKTVDSVLKSELLKVTIFSCLILPSF